MSCTYTSVVLFLQILDTLLSSIRWARSPTKVGTDGVWYSTVLSSFQQVDDLYELVTECYQERWVTTTISLLIEVIRAQYYYIRRWSVMFLDDVDMVSYAPWIYAITYLQKIYKLLRSMTSSRMLLGPVSVSVARTRRSMPEEYI